MLLCALVAGAAGCAKVVVRPPAVSPARQATAGDTRAPHPAQGRPVIGVAFGWILQRSGLSRYDRIANVYRFTDLTVLKVLGSALVTAAVALQIHSE